MDSQPLSATEIWKTVVIEFRKGMPVRKKRFGRRSYSGCFTGPDAVAWLHSHLQTSPVIKNSVSCDQVRTLLQKFLETDVIQDIQGSGNVSFEADKSLFCFVAAPGPFNFIEDENAPSLALLGADSSNSLTSPPHDVSMAESPAAALGKRKRKEGRAGRGAYGGLFISNDFTSTSLSEESFGCDSSQIDMVSFLEEMDQVMETATPFKRSRREEPVPYQRLAAGDDAGGEKEELTDLAMEEIWKELVLSRLLVLIELPSLDGVLTQQSVSGHTIASNISRIIGVACKVGVACSTVAQTCLAALESVGVVSRHDNSEAAGPLPPAAYVDRRRSGHGRQRTPVRWVNKIMHRRSMGGAMEGWPHWVSMAMKCLSTWPEGCTAEFLGDLPVYQGFELDIFDSIVRLLKEEPEPIINHTHYGLYMAVLRLIKRGHAHSVRALQLCLLLLPHQRHDSLGQLLSFIHGASSNKSLQLLPKASYQCNRKILMDQLSAVVLQRSGGCGLGVGRGLGNEELEEVKMLLSFMVKHREAIFEVPEGLQEEVQRRAQTLKEGKGSPREMSHTVCQRVSMSDYEAGGRAESSTAISELLDQILDDPNTSNARKKKMLKKFQKTYPEIYQEKFKHQPHGLVDNGKRSKQRSRNFLKRSVNFLQTRK